MRGLLEALILGFLVGLTPGPVVTAAFTDSVRSGWPAARRTILSASAGELALSLVSVAFLLRLNPSGVAFPVLTLFGAITLLHQAYELWRLEELDEKEPLFSNDRVPLLALFNVGAWVFRFTVYGPLAVRLGGAFRGGAWIFLLCFELAWLSSTLLLGRLVARHRPFFQANRQLHLIYRPVAAGFLLFALDLAITGGRALLN